MSVLSITTNTLCADQHDDDDDDGDGDDDVGGIGEYKILYVHYFAWTFVKNEVAEVVELEEGQSQKGPMQCLPE